MKDKTLALLIATLAYYALAAIAGISAFIYLLVWNWPVALAIFVMLWANNIGMKDN